MRTFLVSITLGLLCVVAFTSTADAGLFFRLGQRRWERRKAELRYELSGQLGAQVTRQVDSATADLNQQLDTKLQAEAARLQSEVDAGLAKLREQAEQTLAAEGQKLQQQLYEQIAQLQAAAQQAVVAEAKKLREETETQLAALKTSAETQIKAAVAKLDSDMSQGIKQSQEAAVAARTTAEQMQTTMQTEIEKLKSELKAVNDKLATSGTPAPAEAPAQPQVPQDAVLPGPPAKVEEEKQS